MIVNQRFQNLSNMLLIALFLSLGIIMITSGFANADTQDRLPTSDILTQWDTTFPAAPATHFDKVDDSVGAPDNNTSYIEETTTNGDTDVFGFPSFTVPAGATVNSVTVTYVAADSSIGNNRMEAVLRVGVTNYPGAQNYNPGNAQPAYDAPTSYAWVQNPATSAAWTVDEVNGIDPTNPLQGFGVTVEDRAPGIRVTQVYITVDYSVAAPCNRVNPNVTIQAPTALDITAGGGTADYTVQVLNNDNGGGCGTSTFTLSANDGGDTGSFQASSFPGGNTITLGEGASGTRTVRVTSVASPTNGHVLTTTVTASDSPNHADTTSSNNASTIISLAGSCSRLDPSVSISPSLKNVTQGNIANYTVVIKNNDSVDCGDTTFNFTKTDTPGVPNANFSASALGDSTTGPLAPGATFTVSLAHTATGGATVGATQDTYVRTVADGNHATVQSNTITSAVVVGAGAGNGLILRRSQEETCHACHRTDKNTPSPGEPGFVQANWDAAIKSHSSGRFGTCSNATYVTQEACEAALATWTPNKRVASSGWGVSGGMYGEILCTTCHTSHDTTNIYLIKETVVTPNGSNFDGRASNSVDVDFRTKSGTPGDPGLMADDSDTPRVSSSRVCEVCHTYDATGVNGVTAHPYSVGAALPNHQGADGTDCNGCHSHDAAFAGGGCDSCHGNPPVDSSSGGPTGLANSPFTTGSTTAGAHDLHANTLSFGCNNCHNGYVMPDESAVKTGFGDISISFSNWTVATGSYSGQSGISYNDSLGSGTKTCSSVYCHGSSIGGPVVAAVWDAAAGSLSCASAPNGACHPASNTNNPTLGSHQRHTGNGAGELSLACSQCHGSTPGASGHVNGSVLWGLNTGSSLIGTNATYNGSASGSSGAAAPTAPYFNCASVYCHSSGQAANGGAGGPVYQSAQWGNNGVACSRCHGTVTGSTLGAITTGSHGTHMNSNGVNGCGDCHTGAANDASSYSSANHVNGSINVAALTYEKSPGVPADGTPGNDYGTCSAASCHTNVQVDGVTDGTTAAGSMVETPLWGTVTSCGECHAAQPATGSHDTHLSRTTPANDCSECHDGVGDGTPNHYDGNIDVIAASGQGISFTYTQAGAGNNPPNNNYGDCASTSCHSSGSARTWGANPNSCDGCHGNPPSTGAHSLHATVTSHDKDVEDRSDCAVCHTGADTYLYTPGGNHINDNTDVAVGWTDQGTPLDPTDDTCASACHTSTAGDGFWGDTALNCNACHGNPPADGGGDNTAHADHISAGVACGTCHTVPGAGDTTHIDDYGAPDNEGTQLADRGDAQPDEATVTEGTFNDSGNTCSTAACHNPSGGSYSADWDTSTSSCTLCHSTTDPGSGSHTQHLASSVPTTFGITIGCSNCHVDPGANTAHRNGTVNFVAGISFADPTCTTTICHNNGLGTAVPTPNWGRVPQSGDNCTQCHSNPPGTGSHGNHWSSSYVTLCTNCHTAATAATHINSTINTTTGYNNGNGTCATASCHGNGAAADWRDATPSPSCFDCHQDTPTNYIGPAPSSGLHVQNGSFPAVMGHDNSFGSGYGCDGATGCHNSTSPSNQHINGTLQNPSQATYSFDSTNKSINLNTLNNATDDTCTASCHTDNNNWEREWSTAAYSTATAVNSARCNVCHGQFDSLSNGTGWRNGTSHQGTFGGTTSTRGSTHDSRGLANGASVCEDCHVYPSASTNHENGSITMNNAGIVNEASSRAWCSACHTNDGAPTSSGFHTFTQSVFPLEQVNGAYDPEGDCTACHQSGGGIGVAQMEVFPNEFSPSTHNYGVHRMNGVSGTVTPHSTRIAAGNDLFVTNSWMGAVSKDTVMECTDCHDTGNTGTDGAAHMGIVDRNLSDYIFLLRTLDTTITQSGTGASLGTPAYSGISETQNMCLNCHRADVYIDGGTNNAMSAFPHVENGNCDNPSAVVTQIHCQHCHAAGVRSDGAHGSNDAMTNGLGAVGSTGFLNGASWTQRPDWTAPGTGNCYTTSGGATSWSSCSRGAHN